jgi:hypothetical protein
MRRKLFNLAAAMSLVLCVATAVFWVRSYWGSDYVEFEKVSPPLQSGSVNINIQTGLGRVQVQGLAQVYPPEIYKSWARERVGRGWTMAAAGRMSYAARPDFDPNPCPFYSKAVVGFQSANHFQKPYGLPGIFRGVVIPLWSICILLGALPVYRFMKWYHLRERARRGLCAICGYDLRATPDRCPECGTAVKTNDQIAMTNQ